MPNVCAYCGKNGKITKEHLYPQFLYRNDGKTYIGYNEAAGKVTVGEKSIRDVCSTCNNEALGKLDAYGAEYFRLNQLGHSFTDEQYAEIHYDYDCLLRWVLKISYNSFRTIGSSENPFSSLAPYILTGRFKPKAKFVKLYIELIRGHKLTEDERPKVQEEFQQAGYVPCYILNSGRVINLGSDVRCHCRHFQVNAHRFTLFIFSYQTSSLDSSRLVQKFQTQFPFTTYMDPETNQMRLRISNRDIFEIHAGPHVHTAELSAEASYARDSKKTHSK